MSLHVKWMTLTGERCPNCWVIHGRNLLGIRQSREVRCDRPRGHADTCRNTTGPQFASERDFTTGREADR